ncbi:BTAD domain-containing putative transcriptional regulator [Actinokineospora sp. NPDC004072]
MVALLGGLPWALAHVVGWPLPDHVPSWTEVEAVVLGPLTTTFLMDFLACLTWLVWAFFALDVARCAVEVAHDARLPDLSVAGPVRRVAAVLVGAVLISVSGQRAGLAHPPLPAVGPGNFAAATSTGSQTEQAGTEVRRSVPVVLVERAAPAKSAVVRPFDSRTGVYDSLWRMAERTLGDGRRWSEIYRLNQGKSRPGGGAFTNPDLVFPGEVMALPEDAVVRGTPPARLPAEPVTPPPSIAAPPPGGPTMAPTTPSQVPAPAQDPHPIHPPDDPAPSAATPEVAFSWGGELFVGLGLAAAVSAALTVVRRRDRRRYRPGSGERDDLPVAPVVYQLRLAHLRTDPDDREPDVDGEERVELGQPDERLRRVPTTSVVLGHDGTPRSRASILPIGVRDGREMALDVAGTRGLGVLGAGAAGAVRALLVTALTMGEGAGKVIVVAEALAVLLGRRPERPLPAGLQVAADLDAALDAVEAETLVRLGELPLADNSRGPLVLVAPTPAWRSRRLQAMLDNGAPVGVVGLLLGQWAAGVTAYVRGDGTISATSPGHGEQLRGTRVFSVGEDHLADLLMLLHRADPNATAAPCSRTSAMLRHLPSDEIEPERGEHAAPEPPARESSGFVDLELLAAARDGDRRSSCDLANTECTPATGTSRDLRLPAERAVRTHSEPRTGRTRTRPRASSAATPDNEPRDPSGPGRLRIRVLGPPRMWWCLESSGLNEGVDREVTAMLQPRLRELVVFLALHPDGASREALTAALWPTRPPERITNALNTTLSRLRRALAAATDGAAADLVVIGEGRYRLDPELVEVDFHRFAAAMTDRRFAATDAERISAYRRVVDSYTGPLADGLSTEWIETARESVRRDALDAVAALARALVDHDPQQTLDLLEIARAFDPHNEAVYRDIMRLQERLGQLDAIPRTLALLTARLAEVDDHPSRQAIDLAERLRHRHATSEESA